MDPGLRALPGSSAGRSRLPGSWRMNRRVLETPGTGDSRAGPPPSAGRESSRNAFSDGFFWELALRRPPLLEDRQGRPGACSEASPRADLTGTGSMVKDHGGSPSTGPAQRPGRPL